jgi:hypothetical protein
VLDMAVVLKLKGKIKDTPLFVSSAA